MSTCTRYTDAAAKLRVLHQAPAGCERPIAALARRKRLILL